MTATTELFRLITRNRALVDFAAGYLAAHPGATHAEVKSAVYTEFGRGLVRKSFEVHCCVDEAYRRVNADATAGLPLFEEMNG